MSAHRWNIETSAGLFGVRTQMNATTNESHVEAMIKKAGQAAKADEAMKFSQAALNAANALCSLGVVKSQKK
jgi:hypothetical protein